FLAGAAFFAAGSFFARAIVVFAAAFFATIFFADGTTGSVPAAAAATAFFFTTVFATFLATGRALAAPRSVREFAIARSLIEGTRVVRQRERHPHRHLARQIHPHRPHAAGRQAIEHALELARVQRAALLQREQE